MKLKFFTILVLCLTLISCSTTFQTSKIQNYEWNEIKENYSPITKVYNTDVDFKLNKKKIEFSIEGDETKIHIIEIESMIETKDVETVTYINVYMGVLDKKYNCKVVYYKDKETIIIFGDGDSSDRYQSFIIFGNG